MKKIYFITDRNITLSDSISRYIIDCAEELALGGKEVVIYSSGESKRSDYTLPKSIKVMHTMPSPEDKAIFHFHLTYTIRKHTEFLFKNIEKIKSKTILTLHVTPEYAIEMGQQEPLVKILSFISEHNLLVHIFSNYAKYDLKKYGVTNAYVVYPGLNLNRYKDYLQLTKLKKKQILVVASNPDAFFVRKVKGFHLISSIKKHYPEYTIKEVVNLTFDEYLKAVSQSMFYIALSKLEHYGLAIVDAYNLFTIPIFSNEGGLTEAIYGNGIPIYTDKERVVLPKKLIYKETDAQYNYVFSATEHTIEKHIKNMEYLYKLAHI